MKDDVAFLRPFAKPFAGKTIYAPGVSGFVGYELMLSLLDAGAHVVSTPKTSFDYMFYLAGIADPTAYRRRPIETAESTIQFWHMMRFLETSSIKGVLYFSSSEIYGTAEQLPTPEAAIGRINTIGPRSCYDEGKRFGETICHLHRDTVPVKIVRPFNVYGPGMRRWDGRAPAQFAYSALDNKGIKVYDETATRTCSYIAEAVSGFFRAILHPTFEVFNIGIDHPEVTVLQMAQMFARHGGSVEVLPPPDAQYVEDSPRRRCPDITKARQLLGYDPKITLPDGVDRWMAWLKWGDHNAD